MIEYRIGQADTAFDSTEPVPNRLPRFPMALYPLKTVSLACRFWSRGGMLHVLPRNTSIHPAWVFDSFEQRNMHYKVNVKLPFVAQSTFSPVLAVGVGFDGRRVLSVAVVSQLHVRGTLFNASAPADRGVFPGRFVWSDKSASSGEENFLWRGLKNLLALLNWRR